MTSRRSPSSNRTRFSAPTSTPRPNESTKRDTGEVEHKTMMTVAHDLDHVLTQFGRADDIEFTSHGEHRPRIGDMSVHDDVHPGHGIGPHAGDSVTGLP